MALSFNDVKGKGERAGLDRVKFVNGVNKFRIVGGVLPMYSYWVPLADGSGKVPMECLGFNRETEQFDNATQDMIRKYFPDMKCSWSYKSLAIDRTDGKLKVVDHKKKLLADIVKMAKAKGDPSDPETGWDIVVTRTKTGPAAFNVEYSLEFAELVETPLTEEEKTLIAESKTIDELMPLPTPEEQEKFILEKCLGEGDESSEEEVPEDFDDDIPM